MSFPLVTMIYVCTEETNEFKKDNYKNNFDNTEWTNMKVIGKETTIIYVCVLILATDTG